MIVCICANVTEKDIQALLPAQVEDIMLQTGCAMNCGTCFEALLEIVTNQAQPETEAPAENK